MRKKKGTHKHTLAEIAMGIFTLLFSSDAIARVSVCVYYVNYLTITWAFIARTRLSSFDFCN